jgi:4-diphosphocytidyl-2-C-methyl-D-erythritol kinase
MQFSEKYYPHKKIVKMIVFPGCKINLGLNIIEKRSDGFHNISSVFYPINWCDALEVISGGNEPFKIFTSGLIVEGSLEDNILFKAWKLIHEKANIPSLQVYLHKAIPMGAGLGGGSSDAASFIKLINEKFDLKLNAADMKSLASQLGSDCAFFIENKPVLGLEKGDVFEDINVDLSNYYILVIYPGVHSNTREAYEGVTPKKPERSVKEIITSEPVQNWKNCVFNDFEKSIFKKYPQVARLKDQLYESGALYASMSGSGSSVFGIYENKPELNLSKDYLWFLQEPALLK